MPQLNDKAMTVCENGRFQGIMHAPFRRCAKWAGGLMLTALLLSKPQAAAYGAAAAMARWYKSVAPSLFPFLALMPLLTGEAAVAIYEGWLGGSMGALFNLPGAAVPAMLIGMIAGTPAGTVAARRSAARAGMNEGQLYRMTIAAMGFSPAFLLGSVGVGLLDSLEAGRALLIVQVLTQLTMAALMRRAWRGRTQEVSASMRDVEEQPVRDAVLVLLTICGYMALFGSIAGVVREYAGRSLSEVLLCLLDVPSGALMLAERDMSEGLKMVLLAGEFGFGGLCLIVQSLGVLKDCGLGFMEYLGFRILAAGISMGYMTLLLRLPQSIWQRGANAIQANPLAAAGFAASVLAMPMLFKIKKIIS